MKPRALVASSNGSLTLPGFTLTRTGLVEDGSPTFEQWQECLRWVEYAGGACQWWLGDALNAGEQRYGEMYSQALEATGVEYQTARDAKWVSGRIELSRRRDNLSWSHHREVSPLEPADQDKLLEKAEAEGWSRQDLRKAVRDFKNASRVREAGAFPEGRYAVVLADPPWQYEFCEADNRQIENHYPTLTAEQICNLADPDGAPVSEVFADDCTLFCWATSPKLAESLTVVSAWGFTYRTCLVWVKDKIGMGYYARQRHELLLVATRGTPAVPAPAARPDSVIESPRGRHSEKPEAVYGILEAMYPDVPKVELFARGGRDGWAAWGNQAEGVAG
jgi:N6-adenosine-specific RNA methylase IME4